MEAFESEWTGLLTVRNLTPHTIPSGLPLYCQGSPGEGEQWVIDDWHPNSMKVIVRPMSIVEADRVIEMRRKSAAVVE